MNSIEKQMFLRFVSEHKLNPDPMTWDGRIVREWLSALPFPDVENVLEFGTDKDVSELVSRYPKNVLVDGKRLFIGRIMREGEDSPADRLFYITFI